MRTFIHIEDILQISRLTCTQITNKKCTCEEFFMLITYTEAQWFYQKLALVRVLVK